MADVRTSDSALLEATVAPPVVAVVVTCNAGPWLEETLAALAAQDYPNLAVLVIDAASAEDPLLRIAQVLPSAYVRRLSRNPGYAAATNRSLRIVQGASHLVLCHDDVAPEPDAIRLLMEEALRSNAGIVAPKSVQWDQPDLLLHMGATVDLTGAVVSPIEPGDLDQGQHDVPSEVFVAPGGCLLVRADLFSALGGFDPAMTVIGEDVDLCWRARVAGAQVRTAPAAKVRHRQALTSGERDIVVPTNPDDDELDLAIKPVIDPQVLEKRHRLRTVLKVRQGRTMPVVVVRQVLLHLAEIAYALGTGERQRITSVIAAWTWNLAHWRSLVSLRRQVQRRRDVDDKVLTPRMAPTRRRLGDVLRADWHERRATVLNERYGREFATSLKRVPVIVLAVLVGVWLLGSRDLISGPLPVLSRFVDIDSNPLYSLARYLGGYPGAGFGEVVTASPSHLIIAVAQAATLGAIGSLLKVMALGLVPLGAWGAARLTKPLRSQRARLSAAIAYAAVPLAYDSVALGRLDALLCYAVAPWVIGRIARSAGQYPYTSRRGFLPLPSRRRADVDEELEVVVVGDTAADRSPATLSVEGLDLNRVLDPPPRNRAQAFWFLLVRRALPLALLVALAAAFAPQFFAAFLVGALGYFLGGFVAGDSENWRRAAVTLISAVAVIVLLLLPQVLGSDAGLMAYTTLAPTGLQSDGLGALLRFSGMQAMSLLTFALLLAAAPVLLMGRDWRFRLGVRLWSVVVLSVFVLWLSKRDWLGPVELDVLSFLPLSAAALALAVAVSAVALRDDYAPRFRWQRRAVVPLSFFAAILAFLPVLPRTIDGQWGLPNLSTDQLLGSPPDRSVDGSYRTLWLGDAAALPGSPRRFADDLAASVAEDTVTVKDPSPPDEGGLAQDRVAGAIADARDGGTVRLGGLLAPYSVRYIVVPTRTGVSGLGGVEAPPPADLLPALGEQLDLRQVNDNASVRIFENTQWLPVRASVTAEVAAAADASQPSQSGNVPTEGVVAVLPNQRSANHFTGPINPGFVYVAEAADPAWRLTVDGREASRTDAFGWANIFDAPAGGRADLVYVSPVSVRSFQVFNLLCWLTALYFAIRHRNRRGRFA